MSAGVVAALRAEARMLGVSVRHAGGISTTRDGTLLAVSGIGAAAASAAARRLADAGASALVSWGLAGGLDPALAAGTVCLPAIVVAAGGSSFVTDRAWRERVVAALGAARVAAHGKLLTSDSAIDGLIGKSAAFRLTGAGVVDMESAAIAAVAAARGLPFLALRVIVDTAHDALPPAVLAASRDGYVKIGPLLLGLAAAPWQIGALLRLSQRYRTARRALSAVGRSGVWAPYGRATADTPAASHGMT